MKCRHRSSPRALTIGSLFVFAVGAGIYYTPQVCADTPKGVSAITAAIAGGYMLIDNSNSNSPNTAGSMSLMKNVFTEELGTGISVDDTTSMFSNNGAVQTWQGFPHTPPPAGNTWDSTKDPLVTSSSKIPSITGLYNSDGSKATQAQAGAIPYSSDSNNPPPTSLCTDQNSESADPSSDPECVKLASPTAGGGLDPFDTAYHPGVTAQTSTTTAAALTAAEVTKYRLLCAWQYPLQGAKTIPVADIHPTGVRLWPGNTTPDRQGDPPWPYETGPYFGWGQDQAANPAAYASSGSGTEGVSYSVAGVPAQISHNGTVYSLYHQIDPSDAAFNDFLNIATTRFMQMGMIQNVSGMPSKAEVTKQIDHHFRHSTLALGSRHYLYLSQQTDASGKQSVVLTFDEHGPDWLGGTKATQASVNLRNDLLANLDSLQTSVASSWNSKGIVNPKGPQTGTVQLDGVWKEVSHSFNTVDTIVNPPFEWNIHDQCFTQSGNAPPGGSPSMIAQITATETAAYQKTSGAYGLLAVLKFQESVRDDGAYFWAPN